jgi:hypothetical protein
LTIPSPSAMSRSPANSIRSSTVVAGAAAAMASAVSGGRARAAREVWPGESCRLPLLYCVPLERLNGQHSIKVLRQTSTHAASQGHRLAQQRQGFRLPKISLAPGTSHAERDTAETLRAESHTSQAPSSKLTELTALVLS